MIAVESVGDQRPRTSAKAYPAWVQRFLHINAELLQTVPESYVQEAGGWAFMLGSNGALYKWHRNMATLKKRHRSEAP